MKAPICGDEILAREVNKEITPFVPLLVNKVEELNYRVKDATKDSLVSVYKLN